MKRLLRPALLTLACVALTSFLVAADAPSGTITVWDGDTAAAGSGWAAPKADTNTMTASDSVHNKGKKALAFKGVGAEYIGCGWNWHGWYPADAGTDISGCDRLRFNFKVTGDAKPADFKIHLVSNNAKSTPDVDVSKYLGSADKGKIDDGEWHEIVIPLKELYGEKKDFDAKLAWEVDVSEWSQDKKDFTAYLDMVQFLPPEPKAADTKPAAAK
jgi:hypothetical protein